MGRRGRRGECLEEPRTGEGRERARRGGGKNLDRAPIHSRNRAHLDPREHPAAASFPAPEAAVVPRASPPASGLPRPRADSDGAPARDLRRRWRARPLHSHRGAGPPARLSARATATPLASLALRPRDDLGARGRLEASSCRCGSFEDSAVGPRALPASQEAKVACRDFTPPGPTSTGPFPGCEGTSPLESIGRPL